MAHLIRREKKAKGRTYSTWLWRSTRRHPDNWRTVQTFDTELGADLSGMRTRVLVGLGEISAADLVTDWVRWYFRSWVKEGVVGPFTGMKDHRKPAAWWVSIPNRSGAGAKVKVTMRSRRDSGYDLRKGRAAIREAESVADSIWRALTDDPILRLAELHWFEREGERITGEIQDRLIDLRRQLKRGGISQRDHDADERDAQWRLDGWEEMIATVRERWDEVERRIRESLPRPRRDALMARVIARSEKLQSDPKQLAIWRNEHWEDDTLTWG